MLLVEDNLVNQRVALASLEKGGFRAEVVGNGREALSELGRGRYDAILMDCQMPEMDGVQATAAIRAREAGGSHPIPIIAMTANAMAGDRERCLEAGMDYISKPVEPKKLYGMLAEWTARSPLPRPKDPLGGSASSMRDGGEPRSAHQSST